MQDGLGIGGFDNFGTILKAPQDKQILFKIHLLIGQQVL